MADTLSRLAATIAARRQAAPDTSYVALLHAKGLPRIAQKVGEEAVETVVAALGGGDPSALVGEAADLLFHLLVLLDARGVPLADVLAELDRREGVSGLAEKTARPRPAPAPAPSPEVVPLPVMAEGEPVLAKGGGEPRRPRIRKG